MTCSNPLTTKGGYVIGCRRCKSCRAATIFDKIGRAYAEQAAHPEGRALAVTLTIGEDDRYNVEADNMAAHILQPSMLRVWFQSLRRAVKLAVAKTRPDFYAAFRKSQRMREINRIRKLKKLPLLELMPEVVLLVEQYKQWLASPEFKEGTTVRYMVAGEHGKKKGRGHYHALIFFRTKQLPAGVVLEKAKLNDGIWKKGFSYWKPMNENDAFYTCKYCLKDVDHVESATMGARQLYFTMSKFPPMGADYFRQVARRTATEGLPFRDTYGFAELRVKRKFPQQDGSTIEKKVARQFKLSRASLELAAEEYMTAYKLVHGNDRWPHSEILERYEDALAAAEPEATELQEHKDALLRQRSNDRITARKDRFKRGVLRDMRSQQRRDDLFVDDALNAALSGINDADWNQRFGGQQYVSRGKVLALADDVKK